jgi:cytochrome c oxidase subunit II
MSLHYIMLVICVVIFIAVFGVMFYSILQAPQVGRAKAANFHESVAVEIAWTVVPFIIVIGMGAMATRAVVAQKDTSNADLTIKATGYQWKWGYDYLKGEGEGIKFLSTLDASHREMSDAGKPQGDNYLLKVDNPLVVPVDRKIRIVTTADDVIHAWMVPSLGVKQDAIPGFVRDTWFRAEKTGDFYGQCAELCGKEHAYMPIHVKVLSQADYAKWVDGKKKEWLRPPTTRPRCGSSRNWPPAARRCTTPTARPATVRTARARPDQAAGRLGRRARRRQGQADRHLAQRRQQRRDAGVEAAVRHRAGGGHHLHQEQLGQQDRTGWCSLPIWLPPASNPHRANSRRSFEGTP